MWLFVFVVAAAEDFLEDVFLLNRGRLCGLAGSAIWWRIGRCRGGRCRWRVGLGCGVAAYAEELLDEVLGALGHLAAGVDRDGAVEECCVEGVAGAGGVGQEVGGFVDASDGDAFGRREGFDVGVLGELDGAVHELSPDGGGGVGALERTCQATRDICVVVISYPHDAEQVRGVAGEPDIVGGSGLAGCGCGEAMPASCGAGAESHDVFEQGLGKEGDAWVEDLLGFGGVVGDDVAVGVADAGEHPRLEVDTAVGEDGVGAGHVDGCGVVGADGDGWGGAGVDDAGGAGEGGYVLKADHLGQIDGCNVERVRYGLDCGDHAGILTLLKVARAVCLASVVKGECGGVVVQGCEGGEDTVPVEVGAVERGVVGGGIDEGFKDGPCGPLGDRVVELGDAVVAASDESEDLAGVRIEGDEGDLWVVDGGGALAVQFADHLVDIFHADLDGFGGGALEFWIERGVDAEALMREALVADALDELIVDEIDEVGGFAGVDVGWGEAEGLGLGAAGLGGGDGTGLDHGVEDDVAALHCALGVLIGGEVVGALDHASEEGGLGEIELAEIFAEVGLGGLAEAVDGEAAALAEVDLVGVHLEDLLLVEAGFELEADDDLAEFAGDTLFWREEEAAGQLLSEGRSATRHMTGENVHHGALGGAEIVDAAVVEEVTVLDGDDGLDEVRWDFVERD